MSKSSVYHQLRILRLNDLAQVFGWVCWYCGIELNEETAGIDHITPQCKGGGDNLENLALSCKFCNMGKSTRDLEEFFEWLDFVRGGTSKSTFREKSDLWKAYGFDKKGNRIGTPKLITRDLLEITP